MKKKELVWAVTWVQCYQLWTWAKTFSECIDTLKSAQHFWQPLANSPTFKIGFEVYGCTVSMQQQLQKINSFSFINMQGKVDLSNPSVTMTYLEEYDIS